MNEEAAPPTLDEFRSLVRSEFAFIESESDFREVEAPDEKYQNPFEVYYEYEGWKIIVGGIDWGYSASVTISDPDGRKAPVGLVVPKAFRERNRHGLGRGQRGDIKYAALVFGPTGF